MAAKPTEGVIINIMKKPIPYNPKLKNVAKKLRKNMTLAEVLLWNHLKGKQICEYDFHGQKPIENYIVDFFCSELMLAIEIDGNSHDDKYEKDILRQKEIEKFGVNFLRFSDREVKANVESVLRGIENWIKEYEGRSK